MGCSFWAERELSEFPMFILIIQMTDESSLITPKLSVGFTPEILDGTSSTTVEKSRKKEMLMQFKFTPEKIMMLLSKEKLQKLEQVWEEYPDGLDLPIFAQLMLDAVDVAEGSDRYEFLHGALKLFAEIDINGDQQMEWSEFMQYMVDAVGSTAATASTANDSEAKKTTVTQVIQKMQAQKFKTFYLNKSIIDKTNHNNYIVNAHYCKGVNNWVFFLERQQREIRFFSRESFQMAARYKAPIKSLDYVITDISYSEQQVTFGCTSTDGKMHFWIYQEGKIKFLKTLKCSDHAGIQCKIWYLKRHRRWITAGRDFKVNTWELHRDNPLSHSYQVHTDEIMDLVELKMPMCVATCSLDRKIVLYNLLQKFVLRVIEGDSGDHHQKGIKKLAYYSGGGGFLISAGFEVFANVWGPEAMVADVHLGKLKGHIRPLVDTKFIGKTPFNATIDETGEIRIWDVKSLTCIQLLKYKLYTSVQGMFGLDNYTIWVYGKRFIQFDTFSVDEDTGGEGGTVAPVKLGKKDTYPMWAEVNNYYLQVITVNKSEVKLIDCTNGSLVKLFVNMADAAEGREITQFKLDKRHRKCYVGDSHGLVRVFNAQSGVLLKDLIEDQAEGELSYSSAHISSEDEASEDSEGGKLRNDTIEQVRERGEITGMQLIWEEDYILLLCTDDKSYYLYNEQDGETSELLRTVTGAHKEDISIVQYSDYLSLIATGSVDGEIIIWDFEMSKVQAVLTGHTGDITALEFLDPYPLLLSCSMDCTLCIWSVRPAPQQLRHICLNRILNVAWSYTKDKDTPITKMVVLFQHMRELPIQERIRHIVTRQKKVQGAFDFEQFLHDLQAKYKKAETPRQPPVNLMITEVPNQEEEVPMKEMCYVYLSDEQGYVKIWNLTHLIEQSAVKKVDSYKSQKSNFNALRKETVNVAPVISNFREESKLRRVPETINPEHERIFVRDMKAHEECIVSLTRIELDIGGLVTCSLDQSVKLWSLDLEPWGSISDLTTDKADQQWCFPTQAKDAKKANEITQVQTLLHEVADQVDPEMNLIFQDEAVIDEEEKRYSKFQERLQKSMRKKIQSKAVLIEETKKATEVNLADLIDQHNNRLSNDAMHEKTIRNLDRRIKDIDKRVNQIRQDQNKIEVKKYHGFTKYLETGIDKQSASKALDNHTQEAMATAIVQDDEAVDTVGGLEHLKHLLRDKSKDPSTERRERVLLMQIDRSRSNSKSRISETLERDRSSLILLKNAPKIRDQLVSCNQQRSRRLFATPHKLRHFNLSALDTTERDIKMFSNQVSNRTLLPSLNNKSTLRLQEATMNYPSSIQLHQESSSFLPSQGINQSRNSSLARLDYRSQRDNNTASENYIKIQSNYGSTISLVKESKNSEYGTMPRKQLEFQSSTSDIAIRRRKSQFITRNTEDAVHIATDNLIRDPSQENGNFQRLKDKYFGEKSSVRLLVKEESLKLRDQKKYIREALPLREIIEKMRKEELRQQRLFRDNDHF